MAEPVLELKNVTRYVNEGCNIFSDISFVVNEGDIVVLQGRSGSGKSTLLKCVAHLTLHKGECLYRGSSPTTYGITSYRTKVLYVPQRSSLLPGSPHDFLTTITSLAAHKSTSRETPQDVFKRGLDISEQWGVDPELWARSWINLSGGESQRILMAAALALDTAEVLLLDEPTSALDSETSSMVESYLIDCVKNQGSSLKAIVWVTHSPEQSRRVGTRFIYLSAGGCYESDDPSALSHSTSGLPSTPKLHSSAPSISSSRPA
ncbi:P-loop containing nucleoside triphosphate hydrolase protein [Crepidotus variabilis]|uniref:P-loop containing nucleoside triphosphate hydrolase protein n=1 Tax=Crepidotus variabilis TaxID=179855 RepID=A0A9P6EQE7_9AGAR|nr:P-loop containing nucleoside triphosphate hydrolase protein [Crepidotus variabilis]